MKQALYTEITGVGEPAIVFLHGRGVDGKYWQGIVDILSSKHKCLVIDLLDHGQSKNEDNFVASDDDHAEAVYEAIKHQTASGQVVLVGHSLGAVIALKLASQYPELFMQLVCFGMPFDETRREYITSNLEKLAVPTVFVYGEHDSIVSMGDQELLAKASPDASFETMPGGHNTSQKRPEITAQIIRRAM